MSRDTSCELVSSILVSPPIPKVVATIDAVVTSAFNGVVTCTLGSILFDFINTITR